MQSRAVFAHRLISYALLASANLCGCGDAILTTQGDGGALDGSSADSAIDSATTTDAAAEDASSDTGVNSDAPEPLDAAPDTSADASMDGGRDAMVPDAATGPVGYVDPTCADGMYSETLPNLSADLDRIPFVSIRQFVDAVLEARYPIGRALVQGGLTHESIANCDERFANGASREEVFDSLGTIVHECGHIYDFVLDEGSTNGYAVNETLQLFGEEGDATDRLGRTFARSYLNTDEFAIPECDPGASGLEPSCDFYRRVYLDGTATDGIFQGGDQGFNSVVEEAYQYINSLAVAWAYLDQEDPSVSVSARDGILTFLWYTARYLRIARTRAAEFPGVYEHLAGSAAWREIILTMWGRAWIYVEATNGMDRLSASGDHIFERATTPALLDEINRIRLAHGCAGITAPVASSSRFRVPAHLIRHRLETPCSHDHTIPTVLSDR